MMSKTKLASVLAVVLACVGAAPARAGLYYDLMVTPSSGTLRLAGKLTVANKTTPNTPTITLDGAGGVVTATSLVGTLTGNAATATAAQSTPSLAASGDLCRGVDSSWNCVRAAIDPSAVSSSTNPVQSGALFTHAALTGSSAHGATSANTASQLVTRDGSGNFSAGTITASVTGHASLDLPLTGGTLSGALNMGTNLISAVVDPVGAQDAATKNYVDNLAPILDYKAPVKYIAVSALPANAYSNGSSGVGATLTGLSLGTFQVDGVSPSVGDRILVNGEATASRNGIYKVTTNGAGAFYVLTRATDHDQSAEMASGAFVDVTAGVTYDSSTWVQQSGVTTVGTDAVNFYQTNGVRTILGTPNQITATTNANGTVTLSAPQNINSGATPTFTGTNFTGVPWSGLTSFPAGCSAKQFVTTNGTTNTCSQPTDVSGGGTGQILYQSASGATAFLPAMAVNGIITGSSSSAIPSTGTLTGTANQVIVTQTGANVVLSAPQNINSGAAPTFAGTNFTGTAASLTCGNVTTNANLTGDVTSVGNATTAAATQANIQKLTGLTTIEPAFAAHGNVTFSSATVDVISSTTYSASWTINLSTQNPQQAMVLTGNTTVAFSNKTAGAMACAEPIQDGTGSRLVTWPTVCWQGGGATRCAGSAPTLSTGKGVHDLVCFRVEGDGNTVDGSYTLGF